MRFARESNASILLAKKCNPSLGLESQTKNQLESEQGTMRTIDKSCRLQLTKNVE